MTSMLSYPPPHPGPSEPPVPYPEDGDRRRGFPHWLTAALALSVGLIVGGVAGGLIGFNNAGSPTNAQPAPPPVLTATPTTTTAAQPYTDHDATWCREYLQTLRRISKAGQEAGAPRKLVGYDVPASEWTPEETRENHQFAKYLRTLIPGLQHLTETASDKFKNDITDYVSYVTQFTDTVLRDAYEPTDHQLDQSLLADLEGTYATCKFLTQ